MEKNKFTHGSLFSGIGGPEIAAEEMGWKNMFHCEINPFGRKILDYWFPNSKSYEDITKTNFTEWRGKINVLTGGFPCQPFSCAGQRKGAEDDRYLWPEMLRAIREIQPDWVVGENVAGILTMVQPGEETEVGSQTSLFGEDNRKRILLRQEYVVETICKDLEREGYSVQPLLIPACAVGAPHRRDRVWIVAHRTDSRAEDVRREREDKVLSDGIAPDTNGSKRNVADSNGKRLQGCSNDRKHPKEREKSNDQQSCRLLCAYWKVFPTQSPVCRGNDGLPFDVDNLTIPFTKWRQKSVKGYGNAIVPQVILEIFKAIEELDN